MTVPDPHEAPTRHGEAPSGAAEASEQRTVPALDAGPGRGGAARGGGAAANGVAGHGAAAPRAAADGDALTGKALGGCRIQRLLGRGAMGAVYQARQEKLDRDVAVKVIRPEMMTDERMLRRFEVEARTVGKFNSPHVVTVYDVGFDLGVHYLVMEFVHGTNLRDHVKTLAGGRLPVGDALPLLRQAIKGLEEAQRLDVIHRDIKPDNLMITDRGVLKIADFGIAKPLSEDFSMTLTSELVGTPLYMSPEQCQSETELDFRSDMYSLGATFYYLLTGEPPIRASSVYELIQTKTKLAHLCLWKALPGLDENNPLSRVIERMTALDREDRYDSYEQLLNDLVLVEHGQTIQVPDRAAAARARARARGGARRGARRLVASVAAVLLLGGGGYAVYAFGPERAPEPAPRPPLDTPPAPRPDPAALAARLDALRARLQDGPSAALRAELVALPAAPAIDRERQGLLADVDRGLAWQAALGGLARPRQLALPFDDLAAHFAAVERAVSAAEPCGPELAAWRTKALAAARAETELGSLALAQLTSAWANWLQERAKLAAGSPRIGELEASLRRIEAGRDALRTLVPALRERVDASVPRESLDQERQRLAQPAVVPDVVDVGASLDEIDRELAERGPSEELRVRLTKLAPTAAADVERHRGLLDAWGTAASVLGTSRNIRGGRFPNDPGAPSFNAVEDYWSALDTEYARLRGTDGSLPAWAAALRTEQRAVDALQAAVVAACGAAFRDWQQGPRNRADELDRLRHAKERALQLFPAAAPALEAAIPAGALQLAAADLERAAAKRRWQDEAQRVAGHLEKVATLADWNTLSPSLAESLASLRASAAPLQGDREVAGELERLDAVAARWREVVARMAELDQRLGAGELRAAETAARSGLESPARAEFALALEVIGTVRDAFDVLGRTLAIDAAEAAVTAARDKLRGAPSLAAAGQRLAKWLVALQQLRAQTAGMVPISGGVPKGGVAPVEPFFLAATECSRAEFSRFLTELREAATGADPQARFDAVAARLQGAGLNPDRLQELLDRDVRAEKLPIDNATWYAAAAYAAWYRRALPTPQEWVLAALGDGGVYQFPWGNEFSNNRQQRNPSDRDPMEVDDGGLSWRQKEGVRLHHLAGNVAEWLAAEPGARQAQLAGGRYTDTNRTSIEEQARGERFVEAEKSDGRRGFGFRTVLRPRSFPGLDWPSD